MWYTNCNYIVSLVLLLLGLLSASEGTSCASGPARGKRSDWRLISTAKDRAGSALPNKILNTLFVITHRAGIGVGENFEP